MTALEAVLFDMDGTLCDTEPSWIAAEFAMANRYGATWTRADAIRLIGQNLPTAGAVIKERMGLDLTPDAVVDELLDGVIEALLTDGPVWRPGAVELLVACNAGGVPTALVTMSYARFVDAVLKDLPAGWFDIVVTGDQVARGKPDPAPYLVAADLLDVDPTGCVAIEDSIPGTASAEAAGCTVVVVPHHVAIPASPSRVVVRSLVDIGVEDLEAFLAAARD
ncbi:MAG: HAD family phosphatase [Propionibacteriales bacterium]|nr:HAD family phosphatase [Propionibacteriales bacterium]